MNPRSFVSSVVETRSSIVSFESYSWSLIFDFEPFLTLMIATCLQSQMQTSASPPTFASSRSVYVRAQTQPSSILIPYRACNPSPLISPDPARKGGGSWRGIP